MRVRVAPPAPRAPVVREIARRVLSDTSGTRDWQVARCTLAAAPSTATHPIGDLSVVQSKRMQTSGDCGGADKAFARSRQGRKRPEVRGQNDLREHKSKQKERRRIKMWTGAFDTSRSRARGVRADLEKERSPKAIEPPASNAHVPVHGALGLPSVLSVSLNLQV